MHENFSSYLHQAIGGIGRAQICVKFRKIAREIMKILWIIEINPRSWLKELDKLSLMAVGVH